MITKQYTLAAFDSFYMHGHLLEALYHLYMYFDTNIAIMDNVSAVENKNKSQNLLHGKS